MKLTYGKPRNGKVTCNIEHKFCKSLHQDDRMTMVMRHVMKKYPDAYEFEFYERTETGDICACRFTKDESQTK